MRPGTTEFQRFLRTKYPQRQGEPLLKGYLSRLSTILRIKPSRMKDLWYGSYSKCDDDFNRKEREKIFSPNPGANIISKNLDDLDELKEIKAQIKREIINELVSGLTKLGEARA